MHCNNLKHTLWIMYCIYITILNLCHFPPIGLASENGTDSLPLVLGDVPSDKHTVRNNCIRHLLQQNFQRLVFSCSDHLVKLFHLFLICVLKQLETDFYSKCFDPLQLQLQGQWDSLRIMGYYPLWSRCGVNFHIIRW